MKEHVLICIVGESCSGKDTIADKLCDKLGLKKLISYTTRQKRNPNEKNHVFSDISEYNRHLESNCIAADTNIGGTVYWATVNQVLDSDIYVIDPNGLQKLRDKNIPNLKIVSIYINVPRGIREERAKQRRDDKKLYIVREYSERKQFDVFKMNAAFDYAIQNTRFAEAFSVCKWICMAEGIIKNNMEDPDGLDYSY